MPDELRIRSDLISLMGVLLPGERSLVSPLLPTGDPQQQDQARQNLRSTGILDATGAVSQVYSALLTTLALSERKSALSMFFPRKHMTIDRYFAKDGSSITLFEGDDTTTSLGLNIPAEDVLAATRLSDDEISSRFPQVGISLLPADFLVLATLMDYERAMDIDALLKSASDASPLPAVIHTDQSTRQLLASCQTSDGDCPFMRVAAALAGPSMLLPLQRTVPQWDTLTAQGVVTPSGGAYVLSGPLQALIRRLILTDFMMDITITRSTGDREDQVDLAYCFRADGILVWLKLRTGRPDLISMQVMPAGGLPKMVNTLLSDPLYTLAQFDAPLQPVPAGPAPGSKAAGKFCPQCGTPLKTGLKFCSSCGKKID